MVAAMTDPVRPNRLLNPNDFVGPRNVLNELYATADAANAIAAEKAEYDSNFPPPASSAQATYTPGFVKPPVPPEGRPVSEPVDGPVSAGRPVVYNRPHVIDAAIQRRIRRGYYD
jgi:hypothetical protein